MSFPKHTLPLGLYQHYKGNQYQVLGVSIHSETHEPLVVYRCLYDDFSLWVRPLVMFQETVIVEGEEVPRFQWLGDNKQVPQVKQASHEYWMQQALALAQQAGELDEVPVGAIVVREHKILGFGFNQPISSYDPTAHAEIQALRMAAQTVGNYRLPGATLYVTLEPCTMCAGAMVHSRIERLVFGATEPKAGAIVSQACQLEADYLNHKVDVLGGVCAEESSVLLSNFFSKRRKKKLYPSTDNCSQDTP